MTPTEKRYREVVESGWREAKRVGAVDALALRHAYAMGVLYWFGYPTPDRPDIVSGYRSPRKQRELLDRWQLGDRAGLVARPACQSWHMNGKAIDVQTRVSGFDAYRYMMEKWGVRWGGRFNSPDPVHFDWPYGQQPPNICRT
jgi:hypothetical protein